ncbi:hypothetical protein SLS60_007132 [Paraconiothyrium brasiliense]|uniref:Uncharacterized protein n=1 Tax=Paraconiothyrium brasiliense TaxID=300254 RepID=A0ABR3R8J0_9PLEO
MDKSTYRRYWHKPGNRDVHRDIPRGEVLSMMNAATKRAASQARMRMKSKDHETGTTKATENSGTFQSWQMELFRTFSTASQAYYSWAEVHALRNAAAKEAADKARRRSTLSSNNFGNEQRFVKSDEEIIRARHKILRTLLREFTEFLHLLKTREAMNLERFLELHPVEDLLSRIDSNLKSSHVDDLTLESLLMERDLYMVALRNSWLADRFSSHFRIVRPLAFIEDDSMDKSLRSEKITNAIRTVIQQGRKEKKLRDKLALEAKLRQQKKDKIRTYHQKWYQPSLRFLNLRQPRVSPEIYRKFKITTRVRIAGEWYTAVIDQSQNSVIDTRIASSQDISKPVRRSINTALFQNFPEEPRVKIRMTLEATQGCLDITPTLTFKDTPCTNIVFGKDLFLQEQVVPRGCTLRYLDEHSGERLDTMRLLDGKANVKVRILLPEQSLDDDEPLYHDQKLAWWDYWESRS